jgi:hypothetical protein
LQWKRSQAGYNRDHVSILRRLLERPAELIDSARLQEEVRVDATLLFEELK